MAFFGEDQHSPRLRCWLSPRIKRRELEVGGKYSLPSARISMEEKPGETRRFEAWQLGSRAGVPRGERLAAYLGTQ